MDDISAVILKDTYSLAQFKHRVKILKSTLLKTFFNSNAQNQPLSPEDLNWLKSLPVDFYQKFNKDNVYQIFTDLEAKTTKLPTLTMYLTFEPDDITIDQIGAYTRRTFSSMMMLDIKFDPQLIAGTALVWKGMYKDYSLRTRINSKKEEILQEFKKFLR